LIEKDRKKRDGEKNRKKKKKRKKEKENVVKQRNGSSEGKAKGIQTLRVLEKRDKLQKSFCKHENGK